MKIQKNEYKSFINEFTKTKEENQMTGNVHIWLVEDALRFVLAKGTEREKQAFQAWESAYGGGDLKNTPTIQSCIVDIIGRESMYTDKYHDLALYSEDILANYYLGDNITEYDGHIFTALNHFLSVASDPWRWNRTDGYNFYSSSKTNEDYEAMLGKVNKIEVRVDNEHSPIVDACRFGWTDNNHEWNKNWDVAICNTVFIPVNILAYKYYKQLLAMPFIFADMPFPTEPVYKYIFGMHLLGPVVHAVADACVPQHAISAMGYKHQTWEDCVEGCAKEYKLEDFNQVRDILDNHMKHFVYTDGELKDRLAIDYIVMELCGWKTFFKFCQLNELSGIEDIRNDAFWEGYMNNHDKVINDSVFFYNLAIAATVRVITESCYDVMKCGGSTSSIPEINGFSSYIPIGGLPERKDITINIIPILFPPIIININSLLGFKPTDSSMTEKLLLSTRENLFRWNKLKISDDEIYLHLKELEKEFIKQFNNAKSKGLRNAEPPEILELPEDIVKLRHACGLPNVSRDLETHSLFGLATFRPPTSKELINDLEFKEYLKASDANRLNAKLIALTRCIAFNTFCYEEDPNRIQSKKIQNVINKLSSLRELIIKSKKLPVEKLLVSQIDLKPISLTAARPKGNVMEIK